MVDRLRPTSGGSKANTPHSPQQRQFRLMMALPHTANETTGSPACTTGTRTLTDGTSRTFLQTGTPGFEHELFCYRGAMPGQPPLCLRQKKPVRCRQARISRVPAHYFSSGHSRSLPWTDLARRLSTCLRWCLNSSFMLYPSYL